MSPTIELLSDLAILAGTAGAIIGSLDIFLENRHKEWLSRTSIAIWYLLSSYNQMKTLDKYKDYYFFRNMFVASAFFSGLIGALRGFADAPQIRGWMVLLVLIIVLLVWMGIVLLIVKWKPVFSRIYIIYLFLLSGKYVILVLVRCLVFFILFHVAFYSLVVLFSSVANIYSEIYAQIVVFLFDIVFLPISITVGIFAILLLPMSVLTVISLIIRTLEILIRKVAEYEKGPVLGASAVLTSIGIIVKNIM